MNSSRVFQEIPTHLVGEAIIYAQRLARHYAQGGSPASRSRSGVRGTEANAMRLAQGKIGEVALVLYFGEDPFALLNWEMKADDGSDLIGPLNHLIDVKTTFPHYKLIWSNNVNDLYWKKRFDTLVGVSIDEADFTKTWIEGWVSKADFFERKKIANNGSGLEPGTWYFEKAELSSIAALRARHGLAQLAISAGKGAEYVLGRWP